MQTLLVCRLRVCVFILILFFVPPILIHGLTEKQHVAYIDAYFAHLNFVASLMETVCYCKLFNFFFLSTSKMASNLLRMAINNNKYIIVCYISLRMNMCISGIDIRSTCANKKNIQRQNITFNDKRQTNSKKQ